MRCVVTLLLALGLACRGGSSAAPPGEPEGAVERLFAAIAAGDCAALRREIDGDLAAAVDRAGCDHAIEEYRRHGLRLVQVGEAVRDGRDRSAYLVRITIERDGREDEIQVRVEPRGGGWRVVTM